MERLYFDITLSDQKNSGVKLMTQVMSNVHRLLKHHKVTDTGLGFPKYAALNPYGNPTLGEVFRLVSSNRASLELISNNVTFKTLASVGVIDIGKITRVPDDAKEVRYYKDNGPIRRMRELKASAEEGQKPSYQTIERTSMLVLVERSGGSRYAIFVGKSGSEQLIQSGFNTYGFSQQAGSTFPEF